jgi:large subunit ribosomal protein L22
MRETDMAVKAVARYVRISPRKARVVADLIRGKDLEEALRILSLSPKGGAKVIEKVVKSAVANAEVSPDINDVDALYVKAIHVDGGPMWKRIRPRAMGRAYLVRKRTSHITVVLDERRYER